MPTPMAAKMQYPSHAITAMLMAIMAMGPSRGRSRKASSTPAATIRINAMTQASLVKTLSYRVVPLMVMTIWIFPSAKVAVATVLSAYSSVAAMSVTSAG